MSETARPDSAEAAFERYLRKPGPRRLAQVVELFHQHVWKVALRVTGNQEDAADVTQDLFLGLLLSPPQAGSVRSPRGYLAFRVLTLTARRIRAAERREKREAAAARRIACREPSGPDLEALGLALDELPQRLRAAVELHYLAGYTCEEIAGMTGVSERTVALDLQRGREALRLRLGAGTLGALSVFLPSESAWPQVPPAGLLHGLLKIAASGSALRPLVPTSILGALLMKKPVIAASFAAFLFLGGAWVIETFRSGLLPGERPDGAMERRPTQRRADAGLAEQPPGAAARRLVRVEEQAPALPWASIAVADEEGQAVPGAEALLIRQSGGRAALKGEGGRFELPAEPLEEARVLVAADGFFEEEAKLSGLAAGETRRVTLMAVHHLVVRTVAAATRASVGGCEVHVHRNLSGEGQVVGRPPDQVLTGTGGGEALVGSLRSTDKLHLFAVHEPWGLMSQVVEVKGPFQDLVLLLEPMGSVRGRVMDASRRPLAGAEVWIHQAPESFDADWRLLRGFDQTDSWRSPREMDRSDAEGRFLIRWPAARRPLIAARADGHIVALRELKAEELGDEIELVLESSALIEGTVLDENGLPATSGAIFSVAGDDLGDPEPLKPWRVYYHQELNVPYRFVLKDVECSVRYLIVEHKGKYRRSVVPLDEAQLSGKRQVEVVLEPDPARTVLVELAVKPFDRVTGSRPLHPGGWPQVSVSRLPSGESCLVHGNREYGGFAWWCAVEPGDYRVEVVTPGFLTVRQTVAVRERSGRRSESGCCAEQFPLEVPLERDPAQRGRFDLPELLHLELLDGRDRKPPPVDREVIWQVFHLPGRNPASDELRTFLDHRDGAVRLRKELKAGDYEVRLSCEGFRQTTFPVTLPQETSVVQVLLSPEWRDGDEARAAIPDLVRTMRFDIEGRNRAQRALIRIGPDAVPALLDLLSDVDLDVRAIAAHALEALGPHAQRALPALIGLLEDPAGSVRKNAVAALGMLGPLAREAAAPLGDLLDDPEEAIRRQARWALDRIAADRSRPGP